VHKRIHQRTFRKNQSVLLIATIPNPIRAIVNEFIKQLNNHELTITQAFVFGSYARGSQSEWSDIDVALISDKFEGIRFNDHCKVTPFILKVDTRLEAHPFRPEDFTLDNPFVEEIVETGVRIV